MNPTCVALWLRGGETVYGVWRHRGEPCGRDATWNVEGIAPAYQMECCTYHRNVVLRKLSALGMSCQATKIERGKE